MSKQGNKGVVPTLRFPEFQDAGEWIQKPLGKITKFSSGGTPSKDVIEYWGGDIPWISASSMHEMKIEKSELNITEIAVQEGARLVKEGTLLLLVRGSMLHKRIPIGITKTTVAFNQDVKALSPNNDVTEQFLLYFLVSSEYKLLGVVTKTGIGAGKLDSNELNQFIVKFPAHAEQQKIADCLSSIDSLITAHTQKLDALKTHKKGLMQQLFPAEGETVPKFRFPEFRDAGEWEEKPLNKVCEVNPTSAKLPESFIYIDLESVESGTLIQKKVIELESAPSRAQRLLKSGDVIFQMVRPYQKNNYFFQSDDGLEYVASTGYAQLRASESKMYLYQYLHNESFVEKVLAKSTGSNYPAINSSDLSQIDVEIPKDTEQQRIADCLSSIDELIAAQSEKIESLKAHKKGLMQQLFPVQAEQAGESLPEAAQA